MSSRRTAKLREQKEQKLTNAHRFDAGPPLWESCHLTRDKKTQKPASGKDAVHDRFGLVGLC